LLGAYQALEEQVAAGTVTMHIRTELLDVVIANGRARGIVTRDLVTGKIDCYAADVVVLATGGYSNVFYLSTNAKASNCTAIWRAHRRGALFGDPCFTQIHPTCIPLSNEHQSKLTLMSESLRNDGRIWVPKKKGETRAAKDIPERERDYYLETRYPSFGNLVPRDVASRNARKSAMKDAALGRTGRVSTWTLLMPFIGWVRKRFVRSTATCSIFMNESPERMHTPSRCGFIQPPTTQWAACGWTTT
jgi:succinate dehydrogenase / fumarate reductase flavoprotein subunit